MGRAAAARAKSVHAGLDRASTRSSASSTSCPTGRPASSRSTATASRSPTSTSTRCAGRLGLLGPDADAGPHRRPVDVRRHRRRAGASCEAFVDRAFELWSGKAGDASARARRHRPARGDAGRAVRDQVDAAPRDRRRRGGGRRADDRPVPAAEHAAERAAGGDRRWRGDRQDDARRREGAAARAGGLLDAARLLQRAAGADARRTRPQDVARGDRPARRSTTFHQLCQDLGREAGVLGERPDPVPQTWWDETLPGALDDGDRAARAAVPRDRRRRGPGLRRRTGWLSLEALSFGGREDVLYVFHDPAQAIYRDDVVGQLGLQEFPLEQNCRNAAADPRRSCGGSRGRARVESRCATDGRAPELIEADGRRGDGRGAAQGPASAAGRGGRARPGTSRS